MDSKPVETVQKSPQDFRYDFILSYVIKESTEFTKRLRDSLKRRKYRVFVGEETLQIGMDWPLTLTMAIESCHIFVPIITPSYTHTEWTRRELSLTDSFNKEREKAQDKIQFFPVMLDRNKTYPRFAKIYLTTLQWQDFTGNLDDKEFERRVDSFCSEATKNWICPER